MLRSCALVLGVSACGFQGLGADAGAPGSERPIDADAPDADADAIDAPGPLGPFANIQPLSGLNTGGSEDDPTLTADMLEIYFERDGDLWFARRSSITAAFVQPLPVPTFNSPDTETTPEISADGLTLYFASNRGVGTGFDIYMSTRANRSSGWNGPQRVAELSSNGNDYTPTPSPDGLTMYLSSDRDGNVDLYRTTRAAAGEAWGAPVRVAELSTPAEDTEPWVDATERVAFWASDRPGGEGGRDLWTAERASTAEPFEPAAPVAELVTTGEDGDPWLSADLRTIVFASTRQGSYDLYIATR